MRCSVSSWTRRAILATGVALGAATAPALADATQIAGSFGGAPIGTVTAVPGGIVGPTTIFITLPATNIVNVAPVGNFAIALGDALSFSPVTLSVIHPPGTITSIPTVTVSVDSYVFTFMQAITLVAQRSGAPPSGTIGLELLGNVHDNSGQLDDNTASLSLAVTQSGTGVINLAESFISPAAPPHIPEPATLALLGAGLVGLGVARRRKT